MEVNAKMEGTILLAKENQGSMSKGGGTNESHSEVPIEEYMEGFKLRWGKGVLQLSIPNIILRDFAVFSLFSSH